MTYVKMVRQLVEVVLSEMHEPTDPLDQARTHPSLEHCLIVFRNLDKRYTDELARKTLAIATGEKKYLKIANGTGDLFNRQQLVVSSEGLVLTTRIGYLNALGESIAKISAVVSVGISLIALLVSITVAIFRR